VARAKHVALQGLPFFRAQVDLGHLRATLVCLTAAVDPAGWAHIILAPVLAGTAFSEGGVEKWVAAAHGQNIRAEQG